MEKKYIFHFIKLAIPYKTDVLLFEENSNDIIVVPLVAKWFKNYVGSDKVNLSISLNDIPANKFQEIINNNYDLISINYDLGKYERYKYFNNINKFEIFNQIKNPYSINDENIRSFFISIDVDKHEHLTNRFNKMLRKEKILKLF